MELHEPAIPWLVLTGLALAGLLVCEWRFRPGIWIAKPLASTGFVAIALATGALGSLYGRLVLLALVLGWVGDVLLISVDKRAFLAGLVAFLASHLAFAVAFWVLGSSLLPILAASAVLLIVGRLIGWPLVEKAPDALRGPARAYLIVISLMVALAAGTILQAGWILLFGAVSFYLSDLAVARQRFVGPRLSNKLLGLPLYYLAQVVFAMSVS